MAAKREISFQILNFRVRLTIVGLTNEFAGKLDCYFTILFNSILFCFLSYEKINLNEICMPKGFVRDRLRKKMLQEISPCVGVLR